MGRRTTVVVTTQDPSRLGDVLECLQAVREQSLPPDEVLVSVDRNPGLVERLRSQSPPGVRVLPSDGVGLSASRNTALRAAAGDMIAFLDDDALPDRRWLDTLVAAFERDEVFAAGGPIRPLWYAPPPAWLPPEFYWILGCSYRGQEAEPLRNLFASNLVFQTRVLRRAGGFSESLGLSPRIVRTGEEAELCLRIRGMFPEMVLAFVPEAMVFHRIYRHRLTLGYAVRRSFAEGYSKALLYRTLDRRLRAGALAPESAFVRRLVRSFAPAFGREPRAEGDGGLSKALGAGCLAMWASLGAIRGYLARPASIRTS